MKPTPNSPADLAPLVAFGAHPDDIEFGCGAVIALETPPAGRHIWSSARAANPQPTALPISGNAKLKNPLKYSARPSNLSNWEAMRTLKRGRSTPSRLAGILRRLRPGIVLAPSVAENQHPDHSRLGSMVRDAARLARYGGVEELRDSPPHIIDHLFFYAQTPESEPRDITPLLIDVSAPEILSAWKQAMEAHASQTSSRNYIELQLTRARLHGLRAGVEHAIALFPNDPLVLNSLADLKESARRF